jgi:hypothetical protein
VSEGYGGLAGAICSTEVSRGSKSIAKLYSHSVTDHKTQSHHTGNRFRPSLCRGHGEEDCYVISAQWNSDQYFYRRRLVVYLCGTENPFC